MFRTNVRTFFHLNIAEFLHSCVIHYHPVHLIGWRNLQFSKSFFYFYISSVQQLFAALTFSIRCRRLALRPSQPNSSSPSTAKLSQVLHNLVSRSPPQLSLFWFFIFQYVAVLSYLSCFV